MLFGSPLTRMRWTRVELALAVVLPMTVFVFTMGSGSVSQLVGPGLTLRWVMLFILAGVAIAFGWPSRHRYSPLLVASVGALGAVGLLSAMWSVTPRITAERAVSFLVLTGVASFIGVGTVVSRRRLEIVLVSLLAGPVVIALAGLVVLVVDYSLAVQEAVPGQPARLRGFGQNPNTASMLFALVLPIAIWGLVSARSNRLRLVSGGAAVLFYASVLASGSRGAILACAGATIAFVFIRVTRAGVLIPTLAALIVFFGATFSVAGRRPAAGGTQAVAQSTRTVTPPPISAPATPATTTVLPTSRFSVGLVPTHPTGALARVPIPFIPEHDEIGFPGIYESKPILFTGSGRVYAWYSAIKQGLQRPLLGYGFGTEQYVFADRFYTFDGGFTENSFVGIFLQLGILGVLMLAAPFLVVGAAVGRGRHRQSVAERELLGVGAGAVAAAFVVAFFQSYLYSVGNVATLSFWIVVFLTVTVASASRDPAADAGSAV